MKKRISLDQLRPGMYLVGLDKSWWNTPFILHHRLVKSEQEIHQLRQSGVKHVEIDPSKGLDVDLSSRTDMNPEERIETVGMCSENEPSFSGESDGWRDTQPSSEFRSEEAGSCGQYSLVDQPFATELNEEVVAEKVRDAVIQAVGKIFEGVVTGVPLDYPLLQETAETVVRHITVHGRSMTHFVLLQNLRAFDKNLFGHVVDVCALTVMMGLELEWSEDRLHELGIGALLHDIGYMRLPANLLHQRQSGSQTDTTLLGQHSELGVSLLKQCPEIPPTVCRLVQEHHERRDGSGAPSGLRGSAISEGSHLIGLIDRFDSLTSHWGATPQKSSAQVLRELFAEAKAGLFDVSVVERMIRCFGIYPVGSLVELSTKERGVVTMINPDDLLKPVVKVISDELGAPCSPPFFVDLADAHGQPSRSITVLLDPSHEGVQVGKYLSLVGAPG